MTNYDDELSDNNYLGDGRIKELEPRTTESGDLLDDSNPFGYDDLDDEDDIENEDE